MRAQHQTDACQKKFLVTVAAFNALDPLDIEDAIRDCPWSHADLSFLPVYGLNEGAFEPSDFVRLSLKGRKGQAFQLSSKTDGAQQLVLLPDEVESMDNAFGPSPFSSQFEAFRKSGSFDYDRRNHADFNMVVLPARTVSEVGWPALRDCVLRFVRGDFGEHRRGSSALRKGGRYPVNGRLVRVAQEGDNDVLRVDLLN